MKELAIEQIERAIMHREGVPHETWIKQFDALVGGKDYILIVPQSIYNLVQIPPTLKDRILSSELVDKCYALKPFSVIAVEPGLLEPLQHRFVKKTKQPIAGKDAFEDGVCAILCQDLDWVYFRLFIHSSKQHPTGDFNSCPISARVLFA